jgi:hypothetical protein
VSSEVVIGPPANARVTLHVTQSLTDPTVLCGLPPSWEATLLSAGINSSDVASYPREAIGAVAIIQAGLKRMPSTNDFVQSAEQAI